MNINDQTKSCSKCKKNLPQTDFYSSSNNRSRCRKCILYQQNLYRQKNRPIILQKLRERSSRNKEKRASYYACAICFTEIEDATSAKIDHNHQTGKVRGILCNQCNTGLGFFKENRELFASALAYLDKHEAKPLTMSSHYLLRSL